MVAPEFIWGHSEEEVAHLVILVHGFQEVRGSGRRPRSLLGISAARDHSCRRRGPVVISRLAAFSWAQAILLPQPPQQLGLQVGSVYFHTPGGCCEIPCPSAAAEAEPREGKQLV